MRLVLVAIVMYMLWGYPAQSQNSVRLKAPAIIEKPLSFDLNLAVTSNLKNTTDADYEALTSLTLSTVYKLTSSIRMGVIIGVEQKLYGEQDSALTNTEVNLKPAPLDLAERLTMNFSFVGVLPTNASDRSEKTLRGATGASIGLKQQYAIAAKDSSVQYIFSGLKNYHEFDRTNNDEANLDYRFRHMLIMTQDLFGTTSFQLLGLYQFGYTYQNAMKTSFQIEEKINFTIDPSFLIYISHANGGDALKANGIDNNIKAYDKSTSTYTTGLVASF